jgi:hypothetical protein
LHDKTKKIATGGIIIWGPRYLILGKGIQEYIGGMEEQHVD